MKKIFTFIFLLFSFFAFSQIEEGKASYYASKFDGKPTASGEIFRTDAWTAAHKNLPFGTKVRVTNLENNKTIVVRINDRGPFVKDRVIDLSPVAADELDFIKAGIARVKIEILPDDKEITAES